MGISDDMPKVQVSIIVPVFNEARLIQPFLARLRERAPGAEIIVVDGASTDGTAQLAAGLCDRLVATGRTQSCNTNERRGPLRQAATFSGFFMRTQTCRRDVWMRLAA